MDQPELLQRMGVLFPLTSLPVFNYPGDKNEKSGQLFKMNHFGMNL
jgi:hypothetical protein